MSENITDIKPHKKLTAREKKFCEKYVLCLNASKAARDAGYSEKTATEIAHQNLLKLHIQEYINEIQKDLEKLCGINKAMVVQEHKKIALSSFSSLHDTWIERKEFEHLKETNPEILDCIQEIETKTVKKIQWELNEDSGKKEPVPYEVEYIKLKLYSKQSSLDSISKMLGYNAPEKKEVTGKDGIPLSPNFTIQCLNSDIPIIESNSDNE